MYCISLFLSFWVLKYSTCESMYFSMLLFQIRDEVSSDMNGV